MTTTIDIGHVPPRAQGFMRVVGPHPEEMVPGETYALKAATPEHPVLTWTCMDCDRTIFMDSTGYGQCGCFWRWRARMVAAVTRWFRSEEAA